MFKFIEDHTVIISILALIISFTSVYINRKNWAETYRPIVTVRVTTKSSGNVGATLNLVVENHGNRPAKNIKLSVNLNKLESVLLKDKDNVDRQAIERCFANKTIIPVLGNGQSTSNSFGFLLIEYDTSSSLGVFWENQHGQKSDWKQNVRLDIRVEYNDLNNKSYRDTMPILIANNQGFAGSAWGELKSSSTQL